jgi:hypothetical protein
MMMMMMMMNEAQSTLNIRVSLCKAKKDHKSGMSFFVVDSGQFTVKKFPEQTIQIISYLLRLQFSHRTCSLYGICITIFAIRSSLIDFRHKHNRIRL